MRVPSTPASVWCRSSRPPSDRCDSRTGSRSRSLPWAADQTSLARAPGTRYLRGTAMRVIVDQDLCEGNAVCERHAPEVFKVGDDDKSQVRVEHPGEALRAKVELAVKRCPRAAIKLVED